jgi:hypothetical protein
MSNFEVMPIRNVVQHYGPRDAREDLGGRIVRDYIKKARWEFTFDQLPGPGLTNIEQVIPAHSSILSAIFIVKTAFASGTSYTVGLQQADGTEIDNDGLLTAANLPVADLTPRGSVIVGTGALITETIGANPGELVVLASGSFTAGRGEIIVTYVTNV